MAPALSPLIACLLLSNKKKTRADDKNSSASHSINISPLVMLIYKLQIKS